MSFIMRPIRFAPTGHIIEGSGLFSSNGVLTRTLSSSDTKKWTVEAIVKKAKDGSQSTIFDGGTTNTNYTWVRFETAHNLRIRSVVGSSAVVDLITTQVFRDFGAYLHIVVTYDSANATASERVKLFINGTQVTDFSTETYPSLNQVSIINSAVGHRIGTNDDSSQDFDGYLSRVTFIDGQALAPTDFGELTDDGFWQINDVSELTFGTNGFLIEGGANVAAGIDTLATGKDDVLDIGDSVTKWQGNTGSYSYAQGAGNEIRATTNDDGIYSSHVFKGDFDFDIDEYDATNGLLGVFASNEVGTFAGADTNGNLDAMTKSFWIQRATGGAANLAYVGGSSEGVTLSHTNGANYRFERRSGTITLYKNDSSLHVFSVTYTGNMVVFIGNGNTSFEAIDVTITDKAGGNNFAATGTITATNDSPTNGGDDDEYGNYCTANPVIPLTAVFTNGNLTSTTVNRGSRGTLSIPPTGKWYFEYTAGNAYPMTGLQKDGGVTNTNGQVSVTLNLDYAGNAAKLYDNASVSGSYGATYGSGDVIGVACDADAGTLTFYKNNSTQGVAKSSMDYSADTWFPHMHQFDTGTHSFNFGSVAFSYTPPSNHLALSTANLSTPAIINPEEHFHSQIVAKSGTTTTFTLPDWITTYEYLIIIKNTSGSAEKWYWLNSLRGVNKYISSNATTAETTDANVYSRSGTTGTLGSTLTSGKSYLIEIHKAGLASATASNTTGSINTVATSANTLSGFALVEYTGNQTAGATIGHGLSVAPEYLFCKQMNASDGNLDVFHVSLGGTKRLFLQTSSTVSTSAAAWNNTAPSSSVITLGDGFGTNKNTVTYMAYVWHGVDAYSSFGSYKGNNNSDGPMISASGSPANYFSKHTTSGESWWNIPSVIPGNEANTVQQRLRYDTTAASSVSASMKWDYLSNGVKIRSTNPAYNTNSALYVYGAWGGQPLTDGAINQGRAR